MPLNLQPSAQEVQALRESQGISLQEAHIIIRSRRLRAACQKATSVEELRDVVNALIVSLYGRD